MKKIERYTNHTVVVENDIFYYYIFRPIHCCQITTYNSGRFYDKNFHITELAKYSSTEHFSNLVYVYCIPNPNNK